MIEHPDIERAMLTGYPSIEYLNHEHYARQCTECKVGMDAGYLHETTDDCYCSSDCAERDLPDMDELLEAGELFWTDWHCEI